MKKLLIIIIYAALLTSCANQSQQAKTEGTAIGAGLGALAGAGIGFLAGGDAKSAAIGAGAGALLGGLGGYAYADNMDDYHEELQGKENNIDAQIDIAKKMNNSLQEDNQHLQTKLAEFNQEIYSLETQAKDQASKQNKLAATRQKIYDEQNKVKTGLASAKSRLSELEQLRNTNSSHSAELDDQIMKLKTTLDQLQQNSNALASLSQRI